jgi:hypothetical protein
MMSDEDGAITWPSAFVAATIVLLVAGVTITAILRYPVEEALKVWGGLAPVGGVITGAVVTYFFSRGSVDAAKRIAAAERERADTAGRALIAMVGFMDPDMWYRLLRKVPEVRKAVTDVL